MIKTVRCWWNWIDQ